jgi:ferrochelatase
MASRTISNKIVKSLNIESLDWDIELSKSCWSSKWIGPSTEDIIIENSKLGKHIVLVPDSICIRTLQKL